VLPDRKQASTHGFDIVEKSVEDIAVSIERKKGQASDKLKEG